MKTKLMREHQKLKIRFEQLSHEDEELSTLYDDDKIDGAEYRQAHRSNMILLQEIGSFMSTIERIVRAEEEMEYTKKLANEGIDREENMRCPQYSI